MKEAKHESVPDFLSGLKTRGAPPGLRERVVAIVEKELGQGDHKAHWFTQTELRSFQVAGALLLASFAFCFLVEVGERSRMTRLDFKNETQDPDHELIPFLACQNPTNFHEWFISYRRMAAPSVQSLSRIQNNFHQIIEIDSGFKEHLRGYHGLF